MNFFRRRELQDFLLKCKDVLSQFKKKRRDIFLQTGVTQHDTYTPRLISLIRSVENEIIAFDMLQNENIINNLIDEYDVDFSKQELIDSLQKEVENLDREIWYNENFDNWEFLSERQNCDPYQLSQRLGYSKCRIAMFNHIEKNWKRKNFPTLHNRLEFF